MEIGMLWFDNDPLNTLLKKVEKAAAYYREKYGRSPNCCFVHPCMLGTALTSQVGGVAVKASKKVQPNHFWLGWEDVNP